VELRGIEPLAS